MILFGLLIAFVPWDVGACWWLSPPSPTPLSLTGIAEQQAHEPETVSQMPHSNVNIGTVEEVVEGEKEKAVSGKNERAIFVLFCFEMGV